MADNSDAIASMNRRVNPYQNFADYSQNQPSKPGISTSPSPSAAPDTNSHWYDVFTGGGSSDSQAAPQKDAPVDPYMNFSNKATGKPYK